MKLMISCREATELLSLRMDQKVPLTQQIPLTAHLGMCGHCRRASQQFALLRRSFRKLGNEMREEISRSEGE